MITKIGKWSKS